MKQTDTERVQALITRQDDGNLRMAYRTDPIPLPRRCVIIGTTNDENPLPNVTSGNRRFVPIVCQKGANVEAYMEDNRMQLWAEALARYREGDRGNLPPGMKQVQRAAAAAHRRTDSLEDMINAVHLGTPGHHFTRLMDIAKALDLDYTKITNDE